MPQLASHPTLQITSREDGDAARLELSGELDRENAWALTAAVIKAERTRARRVTLDLSALTFVDAGGLRAIGDVGRRARRSGQALVVANPSGPVKRLLSLTGIDQTLEIVEDRRRPD